MTISISIPVPQQDVEDFCRRHYIRKLSFFGSLVRDDFGPDSDIDVLVEFDSQHIPGLIAFAGMELELAEILGRQVDLNTPGFFRPELRGQILLEAVTQYDQQEKR